MQAISNDKAVWEYGSSIIGVIIGLIVLFGIIYFFAATTAARGVFDNNFGDYSKRLNNMLQEANLVKKRLLTEYTLLRDTYEDADKFGTSLNEQYNEDSDER